MALHAGIYQERCTKVENDTDRHRLRIAAFLAQALDLQDDPADLAVELKSLKRDANAGIWTVELDSSVGPAAFLVYHYLLVATADDGRTGQALFDADLATLERAAEFDTPGPRILAHALAGDEAFILATTPTTFRTLTGKAVTSPSRIEAEPQPPLEDGDLTRRDAASELLTLLQSADQQARTWLDTVTAGGAAGPAVSPLDESIEFNEEETALALFLLDNRSIQHLLRLLSLLIETAQHRAASAMQRERRE